MIVLAMSTIDQQALETLFQNWRNDRAPLLKPGKAFERFVIEQVLKDIDPSDEDIDSGDLGGGDDGGVDAIYLLMNGSALVTEETNPPDPTTSVELVVIQAKYETGFSETAVEKMKSFCADLLDYNKPTKSLTYLNSDARDSIDNFRKKYTEVFASPHIMKVSFHYATKADKEPSRNEKVVARVANLKELVTSRLSLAQVEFTFWGCSRLLSHARALPQKEEVLVIEKSLSADDGSVVCLIGLRQFAEFLRDKNGNLKTALLEPNVRDYQGARNTVNGEIRATLSESAPKEEFWWLNNGITILATSCGISGNQMKVSDPEIVNGLQTSHEIFNAFSGDPPQKADKRSVLVRVVLATDDMSRNKVIKATNSQTPVDPVSLRTTDRIHFDIEDRLKLYGLYYDRKKGKYRRLRKPMHSIVSMKSLAQATMSILLQRPDDARGRPKSLLKDSDQYNKLFDDGYNRDLYVSCVFIDRQVDDYLDTVRIGGNLLSRDEKRNIRYYVDSLVACALTKMAKPTTQAMASLVAKCVEGVPGETITEAASMALTVYKDLGGTDNVAKGKSMWPALSKQMEAQFPT
jgi:hypothetical protein